MCGLGSGSAKTSRTFRHECPYCRAIARTLLPSRYARRIRPYSSTVTILASGHWCSSRKHQPTDAGYGAALLLADSFPRRAAVLHADLQAGTEDLWRGRVRRPVYERLPDGFFWYAELRFRLGRIEITHTGLQTRRP